MGVFALKAMSPASASQSSGSAQSGGSRDPFVSGVFAFSRAGFIEDGGIIGGVFGGVGGLGGETRGEGESVSAESAGVTGHISLDFNAARCAARDRALRMRSAARRSSSASCLAQARASTASRMTLQAMPFARMCWIMATISVMRKSPQRAAHRAGCGCGRFLHKRGSVRSRWRCAEGDQRQGQSCQRQRTGPALCRLRGIQP